MTVELKIKLFCFKQCIYSLLSSFWGFLVLFKHLCEIYIHFGLEVYGTQIYTNTKEILCIMLVLQCHISCFSFVFLLFLSFSLSLNIHCETLKPSPAIQSTFSAYYTGKFNVSFSHAIIVFHYICDMVALRLSWNVNIIC